MRLDTLPSMKEAAALDVDGIDRSPIVDVNAANSIDNRLTKLLEYLAAQHPEEDWSRYLAHHNLPAAWFAPGGPEIENHGTTRVIG